MRRILVITVSIVVFFSLICVCFAAEVTTTVPTTQRATEAAREREPEQTVPETTADTSTPRLMVTAYTVENGYVKPDGAAKLSVTIKNTNQKRGVRNIKVSLSDPSGELLPDGMGTAYVSRIGAGASYTYETTLSAAYTAAVGRHELTLSMEYEDDTYMSYIASDVLRVDVRQSVKLDFDGAQLPVKAVQGDTISLSVNLMNTGKSRLYNCKIDFDVDGLSAGGSTFVGEIEVGESKAGTANLRVSTEKLGEVHGKITVSYEDDYGKVYTQSADVSTVIEKKVEVAAAAQPEEEKKNSLWWLFLLLGALGGGILGFGIPFAVNAAKQRKEDEKRL